MAMWRCTKCGNVSSGNVKPLTGICGKGGGHHWAAQNGTTMCIWRCAKCGSTFNSINKPMPSVCSRGGNHTWRKA